MVDTVLWANGAQVVDLFQPSPQERRPPLSGIPVHTFHHLASTQGRCKMPEKQSQKSRLVERKVVGSAYHLFNPAIMSVITTCLFCDCCVLNHRKVAVKMIGVLGIFTS